MYTRTCVRVCVNVHVCTHLCLVLSPPHFCVLLRECFFLVSLRLPQSVFCPQIPNLLPSNPTGSAAAIASRSTAVPKPPPARVSPPAPLARQPPRPPRGDCRWDFPVSPGRPLDFFAQTLLELLTLVVTAFNSAAQRWGGQGLGTPKSKRAQAANKPGGPVGATSVGNGVVVHPSIL